MEKKSNENITCTHCDKEALPGTYPPVCEDHINVKQASEGAATLKELESK